MLRIRLSRRGKKRQPNYRIVVADVTSKRDGRFVENIGFYNPLTDPQIVNLKEDRALYWLSVGAQPSDAVRRFLTTQGTLDRLKRFHKGESLEALVAEYNGVSLEEVVEEVEEAVEEADEAAEEAVEAVEEAAEAVEEAAEEAEEAVEEAAEAVEEAATEEADEEAEA